MALCSKNHKHKHSRLSILQTTFLTIQNVTTDSLTDSLTTTTAKKEIQWHQTRFKFIENKTINYRKI